MQRRHFEAIAQTLRHTRDLAVHADQASNVAGDPRTMAVELAITELADSISQFNDNFKRSQFLQACGMKE